MDEPRAYTVDETARILKVTRRTIYNMIKDGRLKAVKIGGEWRISDPAIRELLGCGQETSNSNNRR